MMFHSQKGFGIFSPFFFLMSSTSTELSLVDHMILQFFFLVCLFIESYIVVMFDAAAVVGARAADINTIAFQLERRSIDIIHFFWNLYEIWFDLRHIHSYINKMCVTFVIAALIYVRVLFIFFFIGYHGIIIIVRFIFWFPCHFVLFF